MRVSRPNNLRIQDRSFFESTTVKQNPIHSNKVPPIPDHFEISNSALVSSPPLQVCTSMGHALNTATQSCSALNTTKSPGLSIGSSHGTPSSFTLTYMNEFSGSGSQLASSSSFSLLILESSAFSTAKRRSAAQLSWSVEAQS